MFKPVLVVFVALVISCLEQKANCESSRYRQDKSERYGSAASVRYSPFYEEEDTKSYNERRPEYRPSYDDDDIDDDDNEIYTKNAVFYTKPTRPTSRLYGKSISYESYCKPVTQDFVEIKNSTTWNYKNEGPDMWPHKFPTCRGELQSPINIETCKAVYSPELRPIRFIDYDTKPTCNVIRKEHTVEAEIVKNGQTIPYIIGSDYDEIFKLVRFSFRWGYNVFQGSEHLFDNQMYPIEITLIHESDSKKVTAVGFIFQISKSDNKGLDDLINVIAQLNRIGGVAASQLKALDLKSLLPDLKQANDDGYYRYMGSLTQPPCTQGILWTVYKTIQNISEAQMKVFYDTNIQPNFRPVQNLNRRKVYVSRNNKPSTYSNKRYQTYSSDAY